MPLICGNLWIKDFFTLTFMMRIATPRMMKNPLVFVGRIRPPGRHPPVHPLESKPCRAPSAIANNRRMALRLSALRSELRRSEMFFTLTFMQKLSAPRTMKKSAGFVGRIRPPGRHPPVQLLESKPCLAPSAGDHNRRMTLRLSALRSVLR